MLRFIIEVLAVAALVVAFVYFATIPEHLLPLGQ